MTMITGYIPESPTPELISKGSSSIVPHVIISGSSPIWDMLGEGVEETKLYPPTLGVFVESPFTAG
jgi:hypothetical protein